MMNFSGASRQNGSVVLTFVVALAFLMLLSAGLVTWRLQSFELEMARARAERQVDRVATEVERAMALGVNPTDMKFLEPSLGRLMTKDKSILAAVVLDANGDQILSIGNQQVATSIKPAWVRQASARTKNVSEYSQPPRDWSAVTANDAIGRSIATIWLAYDRSAIAERGKGVAWKMAPFAVGLAVIGMLLFIAFNTLWRHVSDKTKLMVGSVVAILAVAPLIFVARDVGRPIVADQIGVSAIELAENLAGDIKAATDRGISIDRLPGIEPVFKQELSAAKEFEFIALVRNQEIKFKTAQEGSASSSFANLGPENKFSNKDFISSSVPTVEGASLVIGYARDSVSKKLVSLASDLLFAVIIALVVVVEVGRGAVQMRLGAEREASLAKLRLFVFFTALSEELLRPFFAQFASELNSPIAGLTPAWLVALPVMTFMATLALAQPFGPALASRFELRRAMTMSCLAGGVGLILSGFVHDVAYLTVLRGLSGVAYGFALIFAQMAILRIVTSREERAGALAQYALAIVAGGIVGPALGSISAEAFGYGVSLWICAVAMVVAALLALRVPTLATAPSQATSTNAGAVRRFMKHGRALSVVFLAAIPARLVAAAVLLLLAPLYLIETGERTSVVGRVLPLYFLCFYLLTRWAAEAADRMHNHKTFVIGGALISAAACFALPGIGGVAGAAVCCAVLGVGQALMNSPMIVLATDIATRRGSVKTDEAVATFRFLERVGSIAAAPVAAALVGALGTFKSIIAIGSVVGICALLLAIGLLGYKSVVAPTPVEAM
jgi:MFS family permease